MEIVMGFDPSPNRRVEIYSKYLQEIANIKFTAREMDVIACVVHTRGEKKIASLLSIAYRTVGSHVRNIMGKLGCHSKESIIDYFEKSGKLQYLREYYFHLTIQSSFEKRLQKIKSIVNRTGVTCVIESDKATDNELKVIQLLKQHLELANILLLEEKKNDKKTVSQYIYVIGEESVTIKKKAFVDNIILLLDKKTDTSVFESLEYIDFRQESDYYFSTFKLIEKIIYKDSLAQIIQEFKDEYEALQKSWQGGTYVEDKEPLSFKLPALNKLFWSKKLALICVIACVIIVVLLIITRRQEDPDIAKLNQTFAEFTTKFTSDNISTPERRQLNYSLLDNVEKNMKLFANKEVQKYFNGHELAEKDLINYLYICHSLANLYTFNNHDGLKARDLLLKAKQTAEQFIKNKNKLHINFEDLSPEETLEEFKIAKDLPEMYTKIIYLLGRTYTYQGDLKDSIKYFKLANYLGNKLNLYEGFASVQSGLEFVQGKEIVDDLNTHLPEEAKIKLLASIEVFKNLMEDDKEYKINYKPGNLYPETIIPKNNLYNRVFCGEILSKYYARLIFLTDQSEPRQKYFSEIYTLYIGDKLSPGLITLCNDVVPKLAASAYNNLGNVLLKFYEKKFSFEQFKYALIQKLALKETQDLDVIEQVFNIAKSKTRSTEYMKADSYDGLIRVKRLKLKENKLSIEKQNELKKEVEQAIIKRDKINKDLKREGWRLNKHQI